MTHSSDADQTVREPHDEDPEMLAGEPVEPDHDLDISTFDVEDDEFEDEGEDA